MANDMFTRQPSPFLNGLLSNGKPPSNDALLTAVDTINALSAPSYPSSILGASSLGDRPAPGQDTSILVSPLPPKTAPKKKPKKPKKKSKPHKPKIDSEGNFAEGRYVPTKAKPRQGGVSANGNTSGRVVGMPPASQIPVAHPPPVKPESPEEKSFLDMLSDTAKEAQEAVATTTAEAMSQIKQGAMAAAQSYRDSGSASLHSAAVSTMTAGGVAMGVGYAGMGVGAVTAATGVGVAPGAVIAAGGGVAVAAGEVTTAVGAGAEALAGGLDMLTDWMLDDKAPSLGDAAMVAAETAGGAVLSKVPFGAKVKQWVAKKLKNKPKPCDCTSIGKPVSITGTKFLSDELDLDFSIPAPMPLVWQRNYDSENSRVGLLGQGWTLLADVFLAFTPSHTVFAEPSGRALKFPRLAVGESSLWPLEQLTLSRPTATIYQVSTGKGTALTFSPTHPGGKYVLQNIRDRNGNGLQYYYNAYKRSGEEDRLTHIRTDDGRTFALLYEDHSQGLRLSGVEEWRWRAGELTSLTPASRELLVSYRYSAQGDLVQVVNAVGRVTREFAWHDHLMVMHRQPGGVESRYEYTPQGKVTRNWTNLGESWTFRYAKGSTVVVDHLGRESAYHYDKDGYLTGKVDALGQASQKELDGDGLPLRVVDEAGREQHYRYDSRGNLTQVKQADGSLLRVRYHDTFQVPVETRDALGNTTTYRYDGKGNLIAQVDALGNETTYTRNTHGWVEQVTYANGSHHRYTYTAAGQVASRTDCSGHTTRYQYNTDGQLTYLTNAVGQATRYQYTAEHHLERIHYPDGNSEHFAYDPLGRLLAHTDTAGRTTRYTYDKAGRPVTRRNALGGELHYRYDLDGRLVRLINENGAEYQFAYDVLNRLSHEQGVDKLLTSYHYDPVGNLVAKLENANDPQPRSTDYQRDVMGRLLDQHIQEGELHQHTCYRYDKLGRLTQAANPDSEVELGYDALGRLVAETTHSDGNSQTLAHTYDSLGNRLSTTLPDGRTLNWLHYGSGHLHQVNLDGTVISDFERDALHRETRRTQGALTSHTAYDVLGRTLSQQVLPSVADPLPGTATRNASTTPTANGADPRYPVAQPRLARLYHYHRSGELARINDLHHGATDYRYDAIGRLTHANQGGLLPLEERFAFDPAHNLIPADSGKHDNNGDTPTPQRWQDNRLLAYGGHRYTWDVYGNLSEKHSQESGQHTQQRYRYDLQHQLETAHIQRDGQAETWHYAYDPFGRRIRKAKQANGNGNAADNPATTTNNANTAATADPTHITHYLWDGNRLLMEVQGSRSRTWVYPQDGFTPLAMVVQHDDDDEDAHPHAPYSGQQEILHYHTDHLGTPRELTDPDGNLLWAASYQAWGNTRSIDYPDLHDKAQRTAYPQPPEDLARLPIETIRNRRDSLAAAYRSQWRDDYDQPLRFQGQYYDAETGLHYNRFRYYDPDVGRFTTQDPIGLLGGNNLYQYAPNPTAWVDPWGLARNVPSSLPDTPGVYIITNANSSYVGSAGIGDGGMNSRLLGNHPKADYLLSLKNTTTEYIEVNLGSATSGSDRNNILRYYEDREYQKQLASGKTMLNEKPIQSTKGKVKAENLIEKHGASADDVRITCSC